MQLNYYTCGEGFPLVILHGLLGSSDNWQTLAKQFSDRFQVYAVDLRNHGASPHSDRFDYPAMADDLGEFSHARSVRRAGVAGRRHRLAL